MHGQFGVGLNRHICTVFASNMVMWLHCQARLGAVHFCKTASLACAGRAVAYLKEQQKAISGCSYVQLKPVVLTTCKGTLQRLSKLPGWNRQSIRKKWVPVNLCHVKCRTCSASCLVNLHVHWHTYMTCYVPALASILTLCHVESCAGLLLLSSAYDRFPPATHMCSRLEILP